MTLGSSEQAEEAGRRGGLEEFVLNVPPDPDQVRTTRLFAAAIARFYGVEDDRIEDLKVAISEAATNGIKAHREARATDPLRVSVALQGDGLRFSVIDAGPGFDVEDVPAGASEAMTPRMGIFEGSLGLTVIRALFPDVEITKNTERGMTLSFVLEATFAD